MSPQVVPGRALELEREQGYEGKRQDIIKEFPVGPKKALATRSGFWLLILSEGCTFECLAKLAHPFGSVVRGHDDGRQSRRCCWQRWWDRSAGRVASAIRPRLVEQPAFAIRFVGGCCCGRRRWGINSFLRPPRWCVRRFRSSCRDSLENTKALSKYQPPFTTLRPRSAKMRANVAASNVSTVSGLSESRSNASRPPTPSRQAT